MKRAIFLLALCMVYQPYALAEHQDNNQSVYSKKSRLNVENLNNATEVIRDPTRISGSFREALNKIKPGNQQPQSSNGQQSLPDLRLNALVAGPGQTYSAMLKIEDEVRLVKTGYRLSVMSNKRLYEVVINDITDEELRLTLLPANETITLR